jgi:hypothetical protein
MDRISIIVTLVTINAAVLRALREDMRFFPTLKTPWRGIVVAAFTLLVAPLLDMLAQGTALKTAAVTAFLAALPTLISTIVSAFATPQTATQVVAQAVANKAASIKPPPLACLMVCLVAALAVTGCAGEFGAARAAGAPYRASMSAPALSAASTPVGVDCQSLDRGRIVWHGIGVTFGAAGLAGSLTAIAESSEDDKKLRNGLLIGSAVAAGVAVGAEAIATGAGNEWVRWCGQ